ncbi:MAG: chromate efflux transporter [Hyphomicrobium sp.]
MDHPSSAAEHGPVTAHPPLSKLASIFGRIGLLSFGGPAAQIALMHRVLVDEQRWLDERRFLSALSFCMLLPGPEAMQLATFAGWRLHGVKGGLVAGVLFIAPGALLVLALSILYGVFGHTPAMAALFVGVKAAVLAIVLQALLRVAGRAIKGRLDWAVAIAAFVAIFFLELPFPVVIAVAAAAGYFLRPRESADQPAAEFAPVSTIETLRTVAVWLAVWLLPLFAIAAVVGPDHVLAQLAWYFSKLAVVTFGGAYAVLAYMAQQAVDHYHWLSAGEMLDGLGLAETTNGPLILVTEFVGYIAAHRVGGIWLGLAGALVVLWATFVPCFLWIFAGAPYVERLTHAPRLASALRTVTAAVVGVIANLSLWFALHVVFRHVGESHVGPLRLFVPDLASLDVVALVLTALALALVFALRWSIGATLAVCGAAALLWLGLAS